MGVLKQIPQQSHHCSQGAFLKGKHPGSSEPVVPRRCFIGFIALAFICATAVPLAPLSGQGQTASAEYKLKGVFLFNFVQFVDWPSTRFSSPKSPIIIGILGADPFGQTLDQTVHGEIVKGRPIEIRRYKKVEEAAECHVLFISSSEQPRLKSILASLKGRSILTVGDVAGFATEGGMIRFVKDQNKIRFRINVEAAKDANLSISSKLLQLAEIVPVEKRP